MVLACNDVADGDVNGDYSGDVADDDDVAGDYSDDVDEDDGNDDGDDVLTCVPSSIMQSTVHECQGFQSPSSPDKKIIFS